jgi:hypothetical protein
MGPKSIWETKQQIADDRIALQFLFNLQFAVARPASDQAFAGQPWSSALSADLLFDGKTPCLEISAARQKAGRDCHARPFKSH